MNENVECDNTKSAKQTKRRNSESLGCNMMPEFDGKRSFDLNITQYTDQLDYDEHEHKNRHTIITEEQRQKRLEYSRKWRSNFTEEQRVKRSEYERNRRANLTEEQRKKIQEYVRNRRANLTPEQRSKKAEYYRKKRAKLSEEKRIERIEYFRQRRANLSEEQRLKQIEYSRSRYAKRKEKKKQIHIEYDDGHKALQNLMKLIIEKNINFDVLTLVDKNIFKSILQLFEINYPERNISIGMQSLTCDIDIVYLMELFKSWKGWKMYDSFEYLSSIKGYDDLFYYLSENFLGFQLIRDKCILDELDIFCPPENYINVTCSLKELQILFYRSPHNYIKYFQDNELIFCTSDQLKTPVPNYIINCQYISTQITLPNFSMTHRNVHVDEYNLLNVTNKFKTQSNKTKNTNLFFKLITGDNRYKTFLKHNVSRYLQQLITAIEDSDNIDVSYEKKAEVLMILAEFQNDVALCSDTIESNAKYYRLTPYPYARYLGYPDDGDVLRPVEDQKSIKNSVMNVRLQQIRHPKQSFFLENFPVSYEDCNDNKAFTFEKSFLGIVNDCISYKCMLCDVYLGSNSPSQLITDHFLNYHGLEPDWECVNCIKSFSNEYLIQHRWFHKCNMIELNR